MNKISPETQFAPTDWVSMYIDLFSEVKFGSLNFMDSVCLTKVKTLRNIIMLQKIHNKIKFVFTIHAIFNSVKYLSLA